MIKTEQVVIGNFSYTKTYSDAGRYIIRDGEEYEEALDPIDSGRVYTEGGPIPDGNNNESDIILDILLGGAE